MTAILGISAYYHDSAAALVVDGKISAAAQEERFTRKKHDDAFPRHSVQFCLEQAGIDPGQLEAVGFYEKPLLKFERLLETYLSYAPLGWKSFARAVPLWLREKLHLKRHIRKGLGGKYGGRIVFCEHHEAHAASAFFPSPFDSAAILTIDGVGEWATASFGTGCGNRIELSHELHFPHSLGMLYSAVTYYCGFRVNSGEYKLMGLAPYGTPRHAELIREKLLDLKPDGSFRMNMEYFNYCQGLTMTGPRFHELFGRPPRSPETALTELDADLAASIQVVTEEIVLRMATHVHQVTGMSDLCLAGGVALNCVANGRLEREGPFQRIWIQPAAGDAGGALGVALLISHQLMGQPRVANPGDSQQGSYLGPAYSANEIRRFLDSAGAKYQFIADEADLLRRVAELLSAEKVVGWMQGRMEYGPRALGARSILGDARSSRLQSVMNLKTKFRESFRPFAPSVLAERAGEYFENRVGSESPYMLLVYDVQSQRRVNCNEAPESILDRVLQVRSDVPAITHVDYSARVQTVTEKRNERYYRLIKEFELQTGCPVVINTSFNVRGEPIVCTPGDAWKCFLATNMDALVIENFLLLKSEQPQARDFPVDEHLARFHLD